VGGLFDGRPIAKGCFNCMRHQVVAGVLCLACCVLTTAAGLRDRVCRGDSDTLIGKGAHMSNYEFEVERHAGVDMVPMGKSFDWNPGPDDGAPILRPDVNLKVTNPVATPAAD
jgi:hypothetical protein